MAIIKLDLLGSVNIGNYIIATNKYVLVTGETTDEKVSTISETLIVDTVKVVMGDCRIAAPFFVGNKNGLLVSKFLDPSLVKSIRENLKEKGVVTEVLDIKYTAIGNLILANDHGAAVSPLISSKVFKGLCDVLDVEVETETIGRVEYVGSLGVVNNLGGMISPFAKDEEIERLEKLFMVDVMRGTVNSGIPFISSGLIVNDYGAIVGKITDGSELMRITQALKVI